MEKDSTNNKKEDSKPMERSWAGIFDDFLNQPPTVSLFRLYLLSFIIWNKGVLLYIFYEDDFMSNKLIRFYEFIPSFPYFNGLLSMYVGPLMLFIFIVFITFMPITFSLKIKNIFSSQGTSLYDKLFFLHLRRAKSRNREELQNIKETESLLERKTQVSDLQKELQQKEKEYREKLLIEQNKFQEEIARFASESQKRIAEIEAKTEETKKQKSRDGAEKEEKESWKREYEEVKLRAGVFSTFKGIVEILSKNKLTQFNSTYEFWVAQQLGDRLAKNMTTVLEMEYGLISFDSINVNHVYINLTRKGLYFRELLLKEK